MEHDTEPQRNSPEAGCCDLNVEAAVRSRYSAAAERLEPQLCCAVDYDPRYLDIIPPEILERDYGCGDPSKFVRPGENCVQAAPFWLLAKDAPPGTATVVTTKASEVSEGVDLIAQPER